MNSTAEHVSRMVWDNAWKPYVIPLFGPAAASSSAAQNMSAFDTSKPPLRNHPASGDIPARLPIKIRMTNHPITILHPPPPPRNGKYFPTLST